MESDPEAEAVAEAWNESPRGGRYAPRVQLMVAREQRAASMRKRGDRIGDIVEIYDMKVCFKIMLGKQWGRRSGQSYAKQRMKANMKAKVGR